MSFVSPIFLLAFLPATWLLHRLALAWAPRGALLVLVAASLAFYAAWNAWALPILLASVALNYACAKALAARPSAFLLSAGVALNLSALAYFKYAGFLVDNLAALGGPSLGPLDWVMPLGISFITFQKVALLVDAHRQKLGPLGPLDFLVFVSFFPQLVAGPIVHHSELVPQIQGAGPSAGERADMAQEGLVWLAFGLFKKLVVADALAPWVAPAFDGPASLGLGEAWLAALSYSLQLYIDFSAYSEMAIGLGLLFGIRLPINFRSPYQAPNIAAFWRAWHISLSRFLREHVYVPLGGNRHGPWREWLALCATFLLGGLWHGAGWTFVLWGALHAAYLSAQRLWTWWALPWPSGALGLGLGQGLTLLAVVVAWVPFRAPDMAACWRLWGAMVGLSGWEGHDALQAQVGLPWATQALALAALLLWCLFVPGLPQLLQPFTRSWPLAVAAGLAFLIGLSRLGQPSAFLYWQF